jgi:histone H3/H4
MPPQSDAGASERSNELRVLIEAIEQQILKLDISTFSRSAFEHLKKSINAYIVELISESIKNSKRQRADTVSRAHVEKACDYLVSSPRQKIFRHLGTAGGLCAGAAISNVVTMATVAQYTLTGVLLSFILGLVGVSLVTLHAAKE